MLKMRLQQIGRKNDPHSRIIITDSREGVTSGKYVEIIGSYDMKAGIVKIDTDRAAYWLSVGVQPSVTVHNMLVDQGVISGTKKNALPKKTPIVKEAPEEEAAPAAKDESGDDTTSEEEAPKEDTKEEKPAAEPASDEQQQAE